MNSDYLYDFTLANSNQDELIKMSTFRNVVIIDWDLVALLKIKEKKINKFEFITKNNKVMIKDGDKMSKSLDLTSLIINGFLMDTYRSDQEKLLNEDEKKLSQLQMIVKIFNPKARTEIIKRNKKDKYYFEKEDIGLEVILPFQDGAIKFNAAADNDDLSFLTPEDYASGIVSISSINNSWFHCLVKAVYSEYQNNNEAALRLDIVARLRRDIAILLALEDKKYYGVINKYIKDMDQDQMVDYMNSKQELEIEFIYLMAYLFEVNICLIEIPYKLIYNTRTEFDFKKTVVLERFSGSDYHLVAKSKDGLLTTIFDRKDEFIKMIEAV